MSNLKAFTTQLFNFSIELQRLFPEDETFETLKDAIYLLKKNNPRKLLELFRENIEQPYREKIIKRNEDFFLTHNYNEYAEDLENEMGIVDQLKKYWIEITPETKDCIWLYLQVLIKLYDRIV